jgi:hypothetical protein
LLVVVSLVLVALPMPFVVVVVVAAEYAVAVSVTVLGAVVVVAGLYVPAQYNWWVRLQPHYRQHQCHLLLQQYRRCR